MQARRRTTSIHDGLFRGQNEISYVHNNRIWGGNRRYNSTRLSACYRLFVGEKGICTGESLVEGSKTCSVRDIFHVKRSNPSYGSIEDILRSFEFLAHLSKERIGSFGEVKLRDISASTLVVKLGTVNIVTWTFCVWASLTPKVQRGRACPMMVWY